MIPHFLREKDTSTLFYYQCETLDLSACSSAHWHIDQQTLASVSKETTTVTPENALYMSIDVLVEQ